MKRFETPVMSILKLGTEEIIRASGCMVEVLACIDCYCTSVTCDGTYTCTSQVCPILDTL